MTAAEIKQHETLILWLLGSVMFINIVDFMMVMPLGPDFAHALGIPAAHIGWIGGSYTLAASFAGLVGAFFLDRYERRRAFLFCLSGLIIATALCGFTWDFTSLAAARVVAGLFGGPLFSLSLAIVADTFEPARRGQAMGKVMGAFSLAAIAGVPFGLEIAQRFSWNAPFFFLSGGASIIAIIIALRFPRMDAHLKLPQPVRNLRYFAGLAFRPNYRLGLGFVITNMAASFLIIPNISAYVQFNLGYPRGSIGLLYFFGGIASFITMRFCRLVGGPHLLHPRRDRRDGLAHSGAYRGVLDDAAVSAGAGDLRVVYDCNVDAQCQHCNAFFKNSSAAGTRGLYGVAILRAEFRHGDGRVPCEHIA